MFNAHEINNMYKKALSANEEYERRIPKIIGRFMDMEFSGKDYDKKFYGEDMDFLREIVDVSDRANKIFEENIAIGIGGNTAFVSSYIGDVVDTIQSAAKKGKDICFIVDLNSDVEAALKLRGFKVNNGVVSWGKSE